MTALEFRGFSTLYRVDAIEGKSYTGWYGKLLSSFSTLYRVDAIEGGKHQVARLGDLVFQYPLSGRCY